MTSAIRKPRYLQSADATPGKWVVSYSDIITILLVLFVALAAHSLQDRIPARRITQTPPSPAVKSVAPQPAAAEAAPVARPNSLPGTDAPKPDVASATNALRDAEKALQDKGIHPVLESRGLVISLPQSILFPSGEDSIGRDALPIIAQIAGVVAGIPNKISLVGHADSIPIHTTRFRNNWELAAARSVSLLEVLSTRYGIPESRLSIASPGANSPKGDNETEDGRAENRRVEIIILPDSPAVPDSPK